MTKHNLWTYLILFAVFCASFLAYYLSPDEVVARVLAAPGVLALIAALFQLLRDEADLERKRLLQNEQQRFTLGAASHMANTAFDKHVEFCEDYMSEINSVFRTLFREGETPEALAHTGTLFTLRETYSLWLTESMSDNLDKFEGALRKLGAQAHFVGQTLGVEQYAEQRSIRIQQNSELLKEILGIDTDAEIHEDHAVESMRKKLRGILGIEELTDLRKYLVKEASSVVQGGT
jgi:hypothetical protein